MDIRTPVATLNGDWVTKFGELWKRQIQKMQERFGSAVLDVKTPWDSATDVPIVYVSPHVWVDLVSFLKTEPGFEYQFLSDLTATDESPAAQRFEVVLNLFSHTKFNRIRIKVKLQEGEELPTLSGVWPGANWAEREIYDMFGIRFSGHPDLRRILMDERWQGHPLRKDYPLRGYQIFPLAEEINPKLLDK
jgi:NADH/F420H2 dehydrogenase subunit C